MHSNSLIVKDWEANVVGRLEAVPAHGAMKTHDRLKSLPRRLRLDTRGMTAVEFGLIAPPLFLMLIGMVELGLMSAAQAVMDNAAFSASRVGKTGYAEAGKTQDVAVAAAIKNAASGYLDPGKITVASKAYADYGDIGQPEPFTDTDKNGKRDPGEPYTDVNGNGAYDADQGKAGLGASAQIVVYTATYDWALVTPMIDKLIGDQGVVKLTSEIVVKNEPY
jgi:Flp pilus assembly protein TadG